MWRILGVFEVFLGVFEKTKEKKDWTGLSFLILWGGEWFPHRQLAAQGAGRVPTG